MATIEVSQLVKSYGDVKAVDDLSFQVNEGEIFGMLGPNGAGKTTTIECIIGLRDFDSGSVEVAGFSPRKARKELYRRIGVQLQETSWQDKIKVEEICRLFASLYDKPASWEELLKKFGLYEKRNSYVGNLSGGQRQKLSILLALLPDPEIVFLDELTTGLDPKARRAMWEHIRGLKEEGRTVFITTHYMEEAEALCDRVCIIKGGKIIALDSVPEVINACGIEYEITFESEHSLLEDLLNVFPQATRTQRNGVHYAIAGLEIEFIGKLTAWLDEKKAHYRNLNIRKPSLEDAYLKLTGIRVEEE